MKEAPLYPLFMTQVITRIKSGAVINNMVELKDIMPTIRCCRVEIPEKVGNSVMPLARKRKLPGISPWRTFFGVASNHYIVTRRINIWYSQTGEEQYFDLEKDPMELHNGIKDKGIATE